MRQCAGQKTRRMGMLLASLLVALGLDADERLPGGATSVHHSGPNAFSQPAANLSLTRRLDFSVGNSFFRNPWVIAPASTRARDGLGPLFNTNSCQGCHIKDGRGHPPQGPEDDAVSMLVRLSITPQGEAHRRALETGGVIPEPNYGTQLQDGAIPGVPAEGRIRVRWQEKPLTLADGHVVTLRQPHWTITDLRYGPLHEQVQISPRVAPPMIGLGLLEAIAPARILAAEDVDDKNGDGISGKANRVRDIEKGQTVLGRFGWKAGQPTLAQQNAGAFNGDLGLTSPLFPVDTCTAGQPECREAPHGGTPEISQRILSFVTFYTRNLGVPARTGAGDPQVRKGAALFETLGCSGCHTPSHETATLASRPEQSGQTIWPYTDLLLHDMGPGLADGRGEFLASGREWRTPPLWGMSQTRAVSGHMQLLHDGRARGVLEAILWHGGEAQQARDRVAGLSRQDREALVAFVESL